MNVHTSQTLISDVDGALVKRARTGSSNAFDQLVRRHQASVRGFLCRMVSEPSLADDLAQETFLKAWKNLSRWRGADQAGGSFRGWLFSIAVNAAHDQRRSHARSQKRDTDWLADQDQVASPPINGLSWPFVLEPGYRTLKQPKLCPCRLEPSKAMPSAGETAPSKSCGTCVLWPMGPKSIRQKANSHEPRRSCSQILVLRSLHF